MYFKTTGVCSIRDPVHHADIFSFGATALYSNNAPRFTTMISERNQRKHLQIHHVRIRGVLNSDRTNVAASAPKTVRRECFYTFHIGEFLATMLQRREGVPE